MTIRSTQIARLDGLMLCASVDDEQTESALSEVKSQIKLIIRRLNRNSEPQASIESGAFTIHYQIGGDIAYLAITDRSYPRKLAFTYLSELAAEFANTYPESQLLNPQLRPYAFMEFDTTFIQRARATYGDARAAQNLDRLNDELRDVTKVMTKNIEDLLYRGDSLERMGELSSRLRDDSKKYRRAAVKINWDLMVKTYGPFAALGFIIIVFFWWRFF
ncbi:Snare-like protein [Coniochaeta hoffmannii]|uniref:Protein transport protein SEC22 n=1 Tax=Coniochaeta hoffmannii TaxID=91930 RepID=A0AA38R8N2_9PEZI|nr:Snare-like protein [Coniochaeta hoffmannii]